jgi:hypothetical protein
MKTYCDLAPQSGHVSNFCGSVDPVIEPVEVYCFQTDSCEPPTCVYLGSQSEYVSNSPRAPAQANRKRGRSQSRSLETQCAIAMGWISNS